MLAIKNFGDARIALKPYAQNATDVHSAYTLDRMRKLMARLGNPQNKLKIIHVAGTSGKTSTCYYLAAMLQQTGAQVGLTVSPHIDEVNERLQINLKPLAEAQYCLILTEFLNLINALDVKPTYFELLVAMAFWYFEKIKIDYVVMEVGLGGLLDATNVCRRDDKLCVITDIGLDHEHILGSTLTAIAAQKAGIIQSKNATFCFRQSNEVVDAIETAVNGNHGTLYVYDYNESVQDFLSMPRFQQRNWQLAARVVEFVQQRDGLAELKTEHWQKAQKISIPGRMEVLTARGKTIILDGAHNPQKMSALIDSLNHLYPDKFVTAVVAFKPTKDIPKMLELLSEVTKQITITDVIDPDTSQFMTLPATEFGTKIAASQTAQSLKIALEDALKRPEPVVLVTGSFYLVHAARYIILDNQG